MLRIAGLLFGLLLTLGSLSAFAETAVRVRAMHYPAWLVRNYQTLPLRPGAPLQINDLIRTGEGGRVQLQLADGSAIKIGESSRFIIENVPGDSSTSASFQILRGVFRVTAPAFDSASRGYRLEINIGAINATIRNAEIWGRADLVQDAVCLVAGELAVGTAGASRIDMNQALSCYVKPRDRAPLPVDLIDMRQHQLWMAETDLKDDSGVAAEEGQWQLVLISLSDSNSAEQVLSSFHERGFAVLDKTVVRQGRTLHRLLLPGFVSIDAALNARARIERELGLSETWVWKANQD
jgi:hypothetical protein